MPSLSDKIFIIILNWNGTEDTIACVDSLLRLSYKNYQIVLTDNGSEEKGFQEILDWSRNKFNNVISISRTQIESKNEVIGDKQLEPDNLIVIKNGKNLGFAAGNNVALRFVQKSGGKVTLLLNNDTEVHPDFLTHLGDFMNENSRYVACTPRIHYYSPKDIIWNCGGKITWFGNRKYYYAGKNVKYVPQTGSGDISFITGCALLFKPAETGLFTEKFFFGEEDFEFSLRLRKNRKKMACVYDSVIWHKVGSSIKKKSQNRIINKVFYFYASRLIDQKSYYKGLNLVFVWSVNLAYGFLNLIFRYKCNPLCAMRIMKKVAEYSWKNESISEEGFVRIMKKELY